MVVEWWPSEEERVVGGQCLARGKVGDIDERVGREGQGAEFEKRREKVASPSPC